MDFQGKGGSMKPILYLVYGLGFLAFFKLLHYALLIKGMLGLRFKKAGGELRSRADVPSYLLELFGIYEQQLAALGFEFYHCQLWDEPFVSPHSKRWNLVSFNSDNECYACITTSLLPEPHDPAKVEFITFFADHSKLITTNGVSHGVVGEIPNTILIDPYAETLEEQYKAHIERLQELAGQKSPIVLKPQEYLDSEIEAADAYIDSLRTRGIVKAADEDTHQLLLIPVLYQAHKSLKGLRKANQMRARRRKLPSTSRVPHVEIPVEAEVEAFERIRHSTKSGKTGLLGKMLVFLITLLLFWAVFGFTFSFAPVLFLIVVLLIHELGHYLAMVLFGFRDRQILFLPFGAATLGSSRQTTALQRVVVYLMGPAPGIALGACLMLFSKTRGDFFSQFGILLFILNYLNLLPIVPLDGGRVFELALFSRVSFLKNVFLIFSTALFVLGGLYLADPILLGASVLLLIGLRSQIRQNRALAELNRIIRDQKLELVDQKVIPAAFRLLKQERFSKLPFAHKFRIAKFMLDNAIQKPPTFGVTLLSLVLYLFVIFLPIFIIVPVSFILAFFGH